MKKLLIGLLLLPTIAFAQTNLSQGGTGWNTSTTGDLFVGTSSNIRYTRLPIGSTGNVLWVNGGKPAWVATSSLGFSAPITYTGTYPIIVSGSVISSGFSTSTVNNFIAANSFNATTSVTELRALTSGGLDFHSNNGTQIALFGAGGGSNATFLGGVTTNGVSSLATSTISALSLTSWLKDSTNATGTSGQVLTSTGTSTLWSAISGFVTNLYASSTFPSFSYASSTFVTYTYASSTFPSFSYASTTFASTTWVTNTFVPYSYSSSTFVTYPYATSTYVAVVGNQTVGGNKSFTGQTTFSTTTPTYGFTVATTSEFSEETRIPKLFSNVVGYPSAASTTFNLDTLGNAGTATTTIFATTTIVNPLGTCYDGNVYQFRFRATTTQGLYWGNLFASSSQLNLPNQIASGTTYYLYECRQDSGKIELLTTQGVFMN